MAQYTLKLSFDVRQVTQSLAYEVIRQNNSKYPMEDEGPLAGTFNFEPEDEIIVEVIATAPAGNNNKQAMLDDFSVSNCTLVSIPAHMQEFLSLFDETSACAAMSENWGNVTAIPATAADEKKNSRRYSITNSKALSVVTKNGQWQISGYLSVQLPPLGDVPVLKGKRNQLYFFDPEGSVGNGGGFGP